MIVLGGVGCDGTISHENDIVVFSTTGSEIQAVTKLTIPISTVPRPLIVGSSIVLTESRDVIIIGGAATCFSMGTFCMSGTLNFVCFRRGSLNLAPVFASALHAWLTCLSGTRGLYMLRLPGARTDSSTAQVSGWEFSQSGEIVQLASDNYSAAQNDSTQSSDVKYISRFKLNSREAFAKIIAEGSPVLLEGLHVGSCLDMWSLDYLVGHIGEARKVRSSRQRLFRQER